VAPQRDEIFKQKVNDLYYMLNTVHQFPRNSVMEFSEYLQWNRVAPFFLRHPVGLLPIHERWLRVNVYTTTPRVKRKQYDTIHTWASHARSNPASLSDTHSPEESIKTVPGSTTIRQLRAERKDLLTNWTISGRVLDYRRVAASTCNVVSLHITFNKLNITSFSVIA